jgi:glycosyltransferase involved in cell wall biosynthesis
VDATLIRGEDKLETELPAAIHATPAATPVVAVVAGLNNQKGHRYLFEAIPSVARRHPQILFLLVGDGHLRESLKTLARELGISRHVEFLGMRHDVPSILQMSDLFVLPSLFEGMPLSVLEAMAAGKAVVATDVDGTKEVVVDGETGYLVPPRNAEQLARRIDDLLSDDDRRRLFGKQGRERVATTFTTEKMAHAYALLYQELLLHRTSGL